MNQANTNACMQHARMPTCGKNFTRIEVLKTLWSIKIIWRGFFVIIDHLCKGELQPALRAPKSNTQKSLFQNDWTTSLKFTLSPFTNEITSLDKGWFPKILFLCYRHFDQKILSPQKSLILAQKFMFISLVLKMDQFLWMNIKLIWKNAQ